MMSAAQRQSSSGDSAFEEEQQWSRAGENLRIVNTSEKALEQKERELQSCIAQNYARIQGVEKELQGLQLQLKLTSGPKKSALEMLRHKIESQADRVVAARMGLTAATKVADAAAQKLAEEESAKDELCKELNLLVQQSAHAQLDALEALTRRLEAINGGSTGASVGSAKNGQVSSAAATAELQQKILDLSRSQAAGADAATMAVAASAVGPQPSGTAAAPQEDNTTSAPQASAKAPSASAEAQLNAKRQQQAAAARSRHVMAGKPLGGAQNRARSAEARPPMGQERQELPQPGRANQPFRGFE